MITTFTDGAVQIEALGQHDSRAFYADLAENLGFSAIGGIARGSLGAAAATAGRASA